MSDAVGMVPDRRRADYSFRLSAAGRRAVARRLARAGQTMRVRIARDELRRIRELTQTIKALEAEIAGLVAEIAPQLLSEPGLGPLSRGQAGRRDRRRRARFTSDAKLARAAGVAPIPVSSGNTNRHRARPRRQPPDQRHHPPHRRHPRYAATPRPRTTSPANAPKARAPKKPSAVSNGTSPDASGTSSNDHPNPNRRSPPSTS